MGAEALQIRAAPSARIRLLPGGGSPLLAPMTASAVGASPPAVPAASRKLLGALCALGGAACWGGASPFSKRLMEQGVTPLTAAGLLYLGAALGLALLVAGRAALGWARGERVGEPRARLERRDLGWILLGSLVGGCAAPSLMMYGQAHTSGLATALLIAVEPPATALLAVALFGERLTRRIALGGLLVLAGAVLVGVRPGEGGAATTLGALAVAGACTLWALDSNLTTRVARLDPLFVAMSKGAIAGPVVLAVAAAVAGRPFWRGVSPALVPSALALGFVGYGLSLALIVRAFRELGAARTGALLAPSSLFAALAAIVVLGERPTPLLGAAAAVLAVGVWLIVTEQR
jgi:drug/metabolite transporter (DMT)-like permease